MSKKNQLFKKILDLSNLRLNDVVTTSFEKKVQMFKNNFFSFVLNVELSDIDNFTYAESLTLTKSIDKNEMNNAIAKLKADKAFKTDQIFNRMLKMLQKNNDEKIDFYISSMHNRRILFEIIS